MRHRSRMDHAGGYGEMTVTFLQPHLISKGAEQVRKCGKKTAFYFRRTPAPFRGAVRR